MTTTQNCAECGTRAEPGLSFCDACGAVLSWADRAGAAADAAGGGGGGGGGDSRAYGGGRGGVEASGPGGSSSVASAPAGPSTADSGWDAFSRPGAGTGLPRMSRGPLDGESRDGSPHTDRRRPAPPESADLWGAPYTAGAGTGAGTGAGMDAGVPAGAVHYDMSAVHPPATASPSERGVTETAATEPDTLAVETSSDGEGRGERTGMATEGDMGGGMSDRARRLIVPVTEPAPVATPFVAPVLPGRPVAQRPQAVRAPGEELGADGGTPCPWCGTRNRLDRHYCARCAMPMTGEEHAPGRLPWWRRLLDFRNRETPWAGDRPRARRAFDRVLSWLGAAIVLTLLIVLAVNIPQGIQATRDHFAERASVAPDHVSASHSYPGHKPELAFDELNNTWWGPGVTESGKGQWIEASFDEPTRLLDLIITPGVSIRADQNSRSALPHRIDASVTLANGKTMTRELLLDEGAGGQRRSFRFGDVTKVRFTLESAYQPSTTKQVAIAEIEFFGPSNAGES